MVYDLVMPISLVCSTSAMGLKHIGIHWGLLCAYGHMLHIRTIVLAGLGGRNVMDESLGEVWQACPFLLHVLFLKPG